jgi:hypothetical protein
MPPPGVVLVTVRLPAAVRGTVRPRPPVLRQALATARLPALDPGMVLRPRVLAPVRLCLRVRPLGAALRLALAAATARPLARLQVVALPLTAPLFTVLP